MLCENCWGLKPDGCRRCANTATAEVNGTYRVNARRFSIGLVLWLFVLGAPTWAEQPIDNGVSDNGVPDNGVPDEGAAERQLADLRADIEYLASEELRGRSVADETIDEAAQYIAQRMSAIGLDTTLIDNSPFQPLNVTLGARAGAAANNRVTVTYRGNPSSDQDATEVPATPGDVTATLGEGMNPMAIGSGSGEVTGSLVFAGYGITAPKLTYDDYSGIDVAGKTVIILRKEPGVSDPNSRFAGTRNTRHAFFATKIENAIKQGANAVILVNDPASVLQSVQNARSKIARERQRKQTILAQIENLPDGAVNNRKTLAEKIPGIDSMIASHEDELQRAQRGVLGISEAGERSADKDSIPVISLARDLVDQLLQRSAGRSLEEIEKKIDQTTSPQSFELSAATITLRVELKPTLAKTSNVIGVLAGRGELADETVVVGATMTTWEWAASDRSHPGRSPCITGRTTMPAARQRCSQSPADFATTWRIAVRTGGSCSSLSRGKSGDSLGASSTSAGPFFRWHRPWRW